MMATVLSAYADKIEQVSVFGSRATGAAKSSSDIDLVVYGDLDRTVERRRRTLFQESSIPVAVDVVVYSQIKYAPLKAHIDSAAVPLFLGQDLRRAATVQ